MLWGLLNWLEESEGPYHKFDQIGSKSPFPEPDVRKVAIKDNPVKKEDSNKAADKGICLGIHVAKGDKAEWDVRYEYKLKSSSGMNLKISLLLKK